MRYFLLALLLSAAAPVFAQKQEIAIPTDSATHKVTYSEVIQVPGASKADLYSRAKLWAAKTFPSTDATVQLTDAEAGRIIARGWTRINIVTLGIANPMKLWFLVQIDVKDGRYRSIVTDLEYQGEYNPRVTVMSAAAQTARTPADETLTLHNERTHTKKGELRPIFASYRTQTNDAVLQLQAGIKAALTASPSTGVSNSDF
ncbi:DUF4468 domain-containing protein [Hymenobacter metallicola]|uniref:DUF4468 domain-containing protein n=1 Tax=Hymenobacter metallicola TaxID=2563114 RepID=A0A4Z0PYN2_9BACT|nr:DUF4468 domain-containing protein [Hymenobacter metallicola]TGE22827.1 DUF4468 domain-containing protein [Hymenobacter metallicola]